MHIQACILQCITCMPPSIFWQWPDVALCPPDSDCCASLCRSSRRAAAGAQVATPVLQLPKLDLSAVHTVLENSSTAEMSQTIDPTPHVDAADAPRSGASDQGSAEEDPPRLPAPEQGLCQEQGALHDAWEPAASAAEPPAYAAEAQEDEDKGHAPTAVGEADALAALERLQLAPEEPLQAPKDAADPVAGILPALNASDAGLTAATPAGGRAAAEGQGADSDRPIRTCVSPVPPEHPEAALAEAVTSAAEAARSSATDAPAAAAEPQQRAAAEAPEREAAAGAQEATAERAGAAEPPCPRLDMDAIKRARNGAALSPSPSLHVLASPLRQTSGADSPLLQAWPRYGLLAVVFAF